MARKSWTKDSIDQALIYHREQKRLVSWSAYYTAQARSRLMYEIVTNSGDTFRFTLDETHAFCVGIMSAVRTPS